MSSAQRLQIRGKWFSGISSTIDSFKEMELAGFGFMEYKIMETIWFEFPMFGIVGKSKSDIGSMDGVIIYNGFPKNYRLFLIICIG